MSREVRRDRNRATRAYGRSGGYGEYYIDGATARKLDVRREIHERPDERVREEIRREREKKTGLNFGYILFMVAALSAAAVVLVGYIGLQAENKAMLSTIAQKESQLNSMRVSNDEEYSRIVSSVDLEYVKEVAINELGMKYAEEGQIVEIEVQGDDYVRQYQEMP